jgi:hypothetical protein
MTHRYPISALESPPLIITLINRSPQDGPLLQLCALILRIYRFDQDFTSTRSHSSKVYWYLYEGLPKKCSDLAFATRPGRFWALKRNYNLLIQKGSTVHAVYGATPPRPKGFKERAKIVDDVTVC